METLKEVMEMQSRGMTDDQIYQELRNRGISPKEIQNSLNHAKIKKAVYQQDSLEEEYFPQKQQAPNHPPSRYPDENPAELNYKTSMGDRYPQNPQDNQLQTQNQEQYPTEEYQQGYQNQEQYPTEEYQQGYQNQQPQNYQQGEYSPESYNQYGEQYAQEYAEPQSQDENSQIPQYQENYYTQTPQAYQEQAYYSPPGTSNSETISEIAEQIVSEKFSEFKKETGDIALFQSRIQDKVADIEERLKRIETTIDKLQHAIIGKIGEFGENNALVHRDLDNLHNTMSKLVNPLMDNYKELQKISKK
jgi:hypothetical protein